MLFFVKPAVCYVYLNIREWINSAQGLLSTSSIGLRPVVGTIQVLVEVGISRNADLTLSTLTGRGNVKKK
jgi:hypothetical protein